MAGSSEVEQLRDLLLAPEVSALNNLEQSLDALDHQIHDPEQLSRLLAPIVSDILHRGDPALSLALIKAITPLLDRALRDKVAQDADSVSSAMAPASTAAIARHFTDAPDAAARDLAPLMSAAIKEEIRGEREAMIDALYPVIGSTISKYLSETLATLVQTINKKIESRVSIDALWRKLRARFIGVSEAELLLRESLPLRVDAVFLIHKTSGLVIAQYQNPQSPPLDSDLLSGMLTAIRSFFNESMSRTESAHELDQIEYGESKIVLEVAGYCYLAAVVQGTPNESFRHLLRDTMASIVQQHGNALAAFAGDPESVSGDVTRAIQEVVQRSPNGPELQKTRKPYAVILAASILLLVVCVPLAVHVYRNHIDEVTEARTTSALLSARPLPLQGITVDADRGVVRLSGTVPNEYQRNKAERIAMAASPGVTVDNGITAGIAPPFPQLTGVRTDEIVATLSTIDGVFLGSRFDNGALTLTGAVADSFLADKVVGTFEMLPGLRSIDDHVAVGNMEIGRRLHFALNSTRIRPGDHPSLELVKAIVDRTPWSKLLVSGYSDDVGSEQANRRIAAGRAASARDALLALGIPAPRILIQGTPGPPPGTAAAGVDSLSRCVRFELLSPNPADSL
jgi:flagellar motor protein MotB